MADIRAMSGTSLAEFLHEAARRPFRWGELDCCLFFSDWVAEITGVDPALEVRGTYATAREARRMVKANGGIVALVDRCVAQAGCTATGAPKAGDIGLVQTAYRRRAERLVLVPTGAICVRPRMWAVKPSDRLGLLMADFPLVKAWSLPRA